MNLLARDLVVAYAFAIRALIPLRRMDRGQVLSVQRRKLSRLLRHAYRHVPYYRRAFDRAGVRPEDVRAPADLAVLPLASKDSLRAVPVSDTLVDGLLPERLQAFSTSGVTAAPFTIRRTRPEQALASLYGLRAFGYYGLRPTHRRAEVHRIRRGRGPEVSYCKRPLLYRQVCVDCSLPPDDILALLARYAPQLVSGYPAALSQVAGALAASRRAVRWRPEFVTCYSETLTAATRAHIRAAFRAPVYNMYGSRELDLVAWECRETGEMHVCDDNVVLEVLRDGEPVAPGEEGEVVATNLGAFAMPFIRYRIGDLAVRGHDVCPCGAPYSTLKAVLGRAIDYFPLADGSLLHPYVILDTVLDTCDWAWRCEVVQESLHRIVLRVLPSRSPGRAEVERLELQARRRLRPGIDLQVELVQTLPPGPGGKFRIAVSQVRPQPQDPPARVEPQHPPCPEAGRHSSPAEIPTR